ncbi:hypothetical protein ACQY0O_007762 [Thecaphora frezii]
MVSGFAHAPITKGIIILTTVTTVALSIFRYKPYTHLQIVPHISLYAQYWRLAAHHIAFTNASELLLAVLVFYSASREVERRFGSRKFASFLVVTTLVYTLFTFLLLLLFVSLPDVWIIRLLLPSALRLEGRTPSGPFAPLFFVLYQHARIVPDRWMVRIGSVFLGDRTIQIYSLGLLLFFSQPSTTPFVCAMAMATSALYRSELVLSSRLKSYRIPESVYAALSFLLSGMVGSTRVPMRSWRAEPPPPPSFEAREARRTQMREAIDGARDERARRTSAVLQSVGRVRRRFAAAPSAAAQPGILPTIRTDIAAAPSTQTAPDTLLRDLLATALRARIEDAAAAARGASHDPNDPTRPAPLAPASAAGLENPEVGSGTGGLRQLLTRIAAPDPDPANAITEEAIGALRAMFPHMPRARLVEALQMSNASQAGAVERLLLSNGG